MASVDSIGAAVTVLRFPEMDDQESTHINLYVRLFARLDSGVLVFSADVSGTTASVQRDQLNQLEEFVLMALRVDQLPADHRQGQWRGVLDQLATLNINTDPETLIRLPFELLPDAEVRALIGSGGQLTAEPTRPSGHNSAPTRALQSVNDNT
jgi:hypothetical protein